MNCTVLVILLLVDSTVVQVLVRNSFQQIKHRYCLLRVEYLVRVLYSSRYSTTVGVITLQVCTTKIVLQLFRYSTRPLSSIIIGFLYNTTVPLHVLRVLIVYYSRALVLSNAGTGTLCSDWRVPFHPVQYSTYYSNTVSCHHLQK
jgi:hypothetical protein